MPNNGPSSTKSPSTSMPASTAALIASCTTAPSHTDDVITAAPLKLKRFMFTDTYGMSLLKAVRYVDAHLPKLGRAESLYEEVLKNILREVPAAVFVHSQKPSAKTLSDRFKRLVALRREEVKNTTAASGIIEKHGDKEVLLDDLILEMDEKEEATRAEKEQQTENERRFVAEGENIRAIALKRKKMSPSDDGEVDDSTESSAKKRRFRKHESVQSDDDITVSMAKHASERREIEEHRLALDPMRSLSNARGWKWSAKKLRESLRCLN